MTGAREGPGLSFHEEFVNSRLRVGLVWLIALKIAGLLVVIDPWAIQSSDLPKTIFSRATAWLMAGVIASILLRYRPAIIPRSPVHLAVAGLLAANLLSAVVAESKLLALFGDFPRFLGLGFLADMAVLYLGVAIAFRTPRDWLILTSAGLGAFLVTVAYAAAQAAGLDPIQWTDDPVDRPFSTLGNPDVYGHVLSVFLGAGIGLLAFGRQPVWRVLAAACVAVALGIASLVATRGTLVGLGAAIVGMAALMTLARGRRAALGAAAGVAALMLVSLALLLGSPLVARAAITISDGGVRERLGLYDISLIAWRQRPVLGYGVDNFFPAFAANHEPVHYRLLESGARQTSAHSWPLQAAVTTGSLGLAALVAVIVLSSIALLRALRTGSAKAGVVLVGTAAYWAHAAVSVGAIGVDWFAWLAWGSAVVLAPKPDARSKLTSPQGSRWVRSASLAILPVALAAAVLTAAPSLLASHEAWEARDAVRGRQGFRAIAAAAAATMHEPLRADHWNWLGLAYDIHGRWNDEAEAFTRAADLAPHEIQYRVNAARGLARLGVETRSDADFERSRAALATARAADRSHPLSYQVQAEVELTAGRPEAALAQALVAYGLEPRADLLGLVRQCALAAPSSATPLLMVTDALGRRETSGLQVLAAELALQLGRRDIARAHASRALELEPGRADAVRILDQTR